MQAPIIQAANVTSVEAAMLHARGLSIPEVEVIGRDFVATIHRTNGAKVQALGRSFGEAVRNVVRAAL